ncbi:MULTISPECIES: glycosyltransferase family 25 protein [Shewanella]|uniref:Glycosyltransferase family 25 protein n=1 Tax=Shewanella holmiensis TaxID=2952222 RepID=A0A9X3AWI4_9GAMM|nr:MULTISPECIES: glycosyltransferase family 25 protein [Shewanella]MCT7943354.1 glycosyltransferase family 25 protein [Shewanella holmiensis]MDP5147660.1 glycosyltransferase family 25 protein [Shewanella sp. ULN5]
MLKYKVFVINLARSPQRLTAISTQLAQLGIPFERIEGVDGGLLSADDIEAVSPKVLAEKSYHRALGKGEIGCSLSHKRAWQKILDDDLDFAFVLEDDIGLEDNFADVVNLMANLPHANWDFIKLYPLRRGGGSNIRDSFDYQGHQFVSYHKFPISAVAQVVSKQGARSLLKHMPYILEPVDGHIKSWWSLGIYPFGLMPYCVSVDLDGLSDINPHGGLEKMKQRKLTKLRLNWTRAFKRMLATPSLDKHFNQFKNSLK